MSDERRSGEGRVSRRAWIATTTSGVVAASLIKTRADAVDLSAQTVPRPTASQGVGRFPSEVGTRAPDVQPRRLAGPQQPSSSSRSPIQDQIGILTPADLHFERHHSGIPDIQAEDYALLVHGMVERPTLYRLQDLMRLPAVSRIHFVECSGNGGAAYRTSDVPTEITPQQIDGLLSTSEWTGVLLSTLLEEVGVRPGASWLLAEGGDAALMSRSIPLDKAMDDAMIAYGQNGEPIRPEQGYPARVLLPGYEGNAQVKWVRRIEVTDQPTYTRDETSKYSDPLADGTARLFSLDMDAKSIITFPAYPYALPDPGWWEVRGLAWSGRGRITRVDVSTDGGSTWAPARLQDPVLPKCTTVFRHHWNWDGNDALLLSRAVDETGYVQPTVQELVAARGPGTAYHWNNIRAWKVARGGATTFGLGELV